MDLKALAARLFPDITETPEDIFAKYPPRSLPEGAEVTRFGPSPTGFVHLGNLYGALIDERLAHLSGGVFFLRIEDTDQVRIVENGVEKIVKALSDFDLRFDEGATLDGGEKGEYGPYQQTKRAEIYRVFVKHMVGLGLAYPCFATPEELESIREEQAKNKENPGYYGGYAVWRGAPEERINEALDAGRPFVVRLRSEGDPGRKEYCVDLVRGKLEFPENNNDFVLLKSDGIPTYHFAHVVDDTLMKTTVVVRAEEWLATLPYHVQTFKMLGWPVPRYIHTPAMMKMDGSSKRKLSKRKDPELALSFYSEEGFPPEALLEYIMTLLNSNYEEWRRKNPEADYRDFPFSYKKMGKSGPLFDMDKLKDISRDMISAMPAGQVYESALAWAREYDAELAALLEGDAEYALSILSIGRGGKKPRKDITLWSDVRGYIGFFYDGLFSPDYTLPEGMTAGAAREILTAYAEGYDGAAGDMQQWFEGVKALASTLGYAPETKQYKENPGAYKGPVGDVSMALRVAVTGRQSSPDLYEVMRLLGRERVIERLKKAAELL